METGLAKLAQARGEDPAVLLREAVYEYLARTLSGELPVKAEALAALREAVEKRPGVAQALALLGERLKSSYDADRQGIRSIAVAAAKTLAQTLPDPRLQRKPRGPAPGGLARRPAASASALAASSGSAATPLLGKRRRVSKPSEPLGLKPSPRVRKGQGKPRKRPH